MCTDSLSFISNQRAERERRRGGGRCRGIKAIILVRSMSETIRRSAWFLEEAFWLGHIVDQIFGGKD